MSTGVGEASQGSVRHRLAAAGDWLFGTLLLVTAVLVFTPLAPAMPEPWLDQSWMFGMNQAIAQELAIGRDIAFTYGPYAAVYTKAFHPATDRMMVLGGLSLGLSFFLAAWLNLRRGPQLARWGLVLAVGALVYSPDTLLFFYPLMVGVLVCTATPWRKPVASPVLLGLLAAPFGLLPLIKLSTLAACLGVLGVSVLLLALRRQWRQALVLAVVPPLALLLLWGLAGQPLAGLPDYLRSGAPIISGYTEAMSVVGAPHEPLIYLLCAAGVMATAWVALRGSGLAARIATLLLFAGVLFLGFKAGFVRHDFHAAMAASLILLASLLVVAMARGMLQLPALLPGVVAFLVIMAGHPPWSVGTGFDGLSSLQAVRSGWGGLVQRLLEPGRLVADYEAQLKAIEAAYGLPTLAGTSDIYSFNQTLLGASGNRWNPRPVFQSYSVYAPELSEMNRQHLLAPGRPDNLFFTIQPIDRRLPALDDGASWRVMLADYTPAMAAGDYIVLQHRTGNGRTLGPETAVTLDGRLGQALALPPGGGLMFARLQIRPSLLGRLWHILYKPAELWVAVTTRDGETRSFRLIAGMAQSEFLLSPLVLNTGQFAFLYSGQDQTQQEVTALTISAVGWQPSWQEDYRLELTRVPAAAVAAQP